MRRNLQERRSATLYRVESLFSVDNGQVIKIDDVEHHIEGEIDGWLVASVPEITTHGAAEMIKRQLEKATGRPVLLISHNIELMRIVKLTASEAAKAIKYAEDKAMSDDGNNKVPNTDHELDSLGGRSGVNVNGSNDGHTGDLTDQTPDIINGDGINGGHISKSEEENETTS